MLLGSSVSTVQETIWQRASRQQTFSDVCASVPCRRLVHVWYPADLEGCHRYDRWRISGGVGRKEKTKRNPWLAEQWRSIVLFVCQFSSINVCPPAARTAFLSANSRGVRVFIVDLNRVTTYPPQGERTFESWTSICESMFLAKKYFSFSSMNRDVV